MSRVKVIDGYPGCGKTSFGIQTINESDSDTKIIYITPYLDEVNRIIKSCPNKNFVQPDARKGKGSKLRHLVQLVMDGENIVSTHALFSNISDELIQALRLHEYILFLDEVFQTIDKWNVSGKKDLAREQQDHITRNDVSILKDDNTIGVDDDYTIRWLSNKTLSFYEPMKEMANRGLLYLVSDSLLLWSFPISVFMEGTFSEVFIMTHQFSSQMQSYYYDYFELDYSIYHIVHDHINNKFSIEKGLHDESEWKQKILRKIVFQQNHKINKIGEAYYDTKNRLHETTLSSNWYDKNPSFIPILQNNMRNFFTNITHSKSSERLWTCFKPHINLLKSKNVSPKNHISVNSRATNNYGDRTVLAYMVNRYINPYYNLFFKKRNIQIDQDKFALSEMLQWIFRSAIRNDKEIQIYIPSERMRNLLRKYLEY